MIPNVCFFICGNWAKSFLPDIQISTAPILGYISRNRKYLWRTDGAHPMPLTFGRISTDDNKSIIKAYVGEGVNR